MGLEQTRRDLDYHIGPLIDRERAADVMLRLGFNGLVLTHPTNVYYLTGYDGSNFNSSLPTNFPCYALISKDPSQPIALVIASFQYYFGFSDIHNDNDVVVYQHTSVPDAEDRDVSNNNAILATGLAPLRAGQPLVWRNRGQMALDQIETVRAARVEREAKARHVGISAMQSLGRALADLGLDRGTIGVEFPRDSTVGATIERAAPKVVSADATRAMALLRIIKSESEIGLMRHAARNNAEAALAACRAVCAGATYRDLRAQFFSEAARRGNLGVWMLVDRVSVDAFRGEFHEGQSLMIDAVSTFAGYHGDYGRTVFIGEPTHHMVRHTQAISHAWCVVREHLRPGVSFREIQQIAQSALDHGGFDTAVRFTPHSVGLFHTDARALDDIVLERGMTISVDCPVVESGIGGSAHLEDLTLITATGHETMNALDDQVIIV